MELEGQVVEAASARMGEMLPLWEQALQSAEQRKRRRVLKKRVRRAGRNAPRRQHFIPRYWVLGFAEPPGMAGKVMALDVCGRKGPTKVGPKRAASEEHFYTLTDAAGEQSAALEDALGRLESDAAPAFKQMAAGNLPGSLLERLDVSFLLAAQVLRTPGSLSPFQQAMSDLGRNIVEMAQQEGKLPAIEGGFEVAVDPRAVLKAVLNDYTLTGCAGWLFCRRWTLAKASEDSSGFVLPERAVVMHSGSRGGRHWPGGVETAHDVLVAVSCRVLLMMHWMDVADPNGMEVPADLVTEFNAHLCNFGGPTVFCAPSDTEAVTQMLARQIPQPGSLEEPEPVV